MVTTPTTTTSPEKCLLLSSLIILSRAWEPSNQARKELRASCTVVDSPRYDFQQSLSYCFLLILLFVFPFFEFPCCGQTFHAEITQERKILNKFIFSKFSFDWFKHCRDLLLNFPSWAKDVSFLFKFLKIILLINFIDFLAHFIVVCWDRSSDISISCKISWGRLFLCMFLNLPRFFNSEFIFVDDVHRDRQVGRGY